MSRNSMYYIYIQEEKDVHPPSTISKKLIFTNPSVFPAPALQACRPFAPPINSRTPRVPLCHDRNGEDGPPQRT